MHDIALPPRYRRRFFFLCLNSCSFAPTQSGCRFHSWKDSFLIRMLRPDPVRVVADDPHDISFIQHQPDYYIFLVFSRFRNQGNLNKFPFVHNVCTIACKYIYNIVILYVQYIYKTKTILPRSSNCLPIRTITAKPEVKWTKKRLPTI